MAGKTPCGYARIIRGDCLISSCKKRVLITMDIKQIVREMLAAGMPEAEILSNLTDLGVPDAPKVLSDAKAATAQKSQQQKPEQEEAPKPHSSLFSEEPAVKAPAQKQYLFDEKSISDSSTGMFGQSSGSSMGSDQKIDELMALTRSLLELNKKILDSNREILLKLSK